MAGERRGWTSMFRRQEVVGQDLLGKFTASIARIFEGASEEQTLRQIRSELTQLFGCEDVALFFQDPLDPPRTDEGEWALTVRSGLGEGNRVAQRDARAHAQVVPGKPVPYTEEVAEAAFLKSVALAFEENAFYGADFERKVVLIKDPTPADDLGSGDLSVLAIPLRYHNRVGRIVEEARVGVLALFNTPVRTEWGDLEKGLRSLLAYAVVAPTVALKDPVTDLYTEAHLRTELSRFMSLRDITKGKLQGGLVVGMIDTLRLYKQTLLAEGNVVPDEVSRRLSDTLEGVARCLWNRCADHDLGGADETYKAGVPARVGREGFAVLLPLLKPRDLLQWARKLSREVIAADFEAEELLATGDVTVSLRIIPLGGLKARNPAETWRTAKAVLEEIDQEQARAMKDSARLTEAVNTVRILSEGEWLSPSDYVRDLL